MFRQLKDKTLLVPLCGSLVLLAFALWINYQAAEYAFQQASNPVTDLILSNTRVYDVDLVFVFGSVAFWTGVIIMLLTDLRLVPFTLKSISLFIVIRAFFISLTHIAPFPERLPPPSTNFILNKLTFGSDLFFSGHTGLPFLLALIYWNNKTLRHIFLAGSATFGASAILGHYHYSIDVFAAYFITYAIFRLAEKWFASDQRIFWTAPLGGKRPEAR